MSPTLLMVINDPGFFISHRLPLAEGARRAGYSVHIATMPGEAVQRIRDSGFHHTELPLSRSGKGFLGELRAVRAIWWLLWQVRPEVLHLVTIKPVLYGGICARLAPVKGVVAAISGLGFVFVSRKERTLLQKVVTWLYRLALGKRRLRVIFQNPDDRDLLVSMGAVTPDKTEIIPGSGVDLSRYPYLNEVDGTPKVCFAARLLRDKGVVEFVEAARILRERGVAVHCQLIGDADPGNPTTITTSELESWRDEGVVELLGYRTDISRLFGAAHIVVLPSYYGEGLPKVLVEAAACGRPVITTDHPGCRDAIEPNVSGILIPVRNSEALADAIEQLVNDPELRRQMGQAGRELAERKFSIDDIVQQHLEIYNKLQSSS